MSGTMQKSQRYLMMVLPFVFIPFILRFPTGLVLYWMTTNLWTVGQGLITRRLMPKVGPPFGPARTGRAEAVVPDSAQAAAAAGRWDADRRGPAPKPSNGPPRRVKRKKKARR